MPKQRSFITDEPLSRHMCAMVAAIVFACLPTSAGAAPLIDSRGSGEGLKLIAEIPVDHGTHLELARIRGRDYAFVNTNSPAAATRETSRSRTIEERCWSAWTLPPE
jgi:hypothetical protein